MTDEFKAYWLREHFDLSTSAASIAWSAWQESRSALESGHQKLVAHCASLANAHSNLAIAAAAVASFIGGAKDRLGRPDPGASEEMRAAREQVRELAVHYGVGGDHRTYLDQCAALLSAAAKATGNAS